MKKEQEKQINDNVTTTHKKRKPIEYHGDTGSRLYTVYGDMKSRCTNPNAPNYYLYGGRGITICDEWSDSYLNFKEWALSHGYDENAKYGECTLDRVDVNKGYSPDNCRFVSLKVQANNKRNTRYVEFNDQDITLSDFSDITGIGKNTIRDRMKRMGMTPEEIANTPIDDFQKKITVDGATDTLTNFCEMYHRNRELVRDRIFKQGWDPKIALTTPLCFASPKYDTHEYMGAIGNYRDFDRAMGFKGGTISSRVRKQGMTFEEALTTPITGKKKNALISAVFFIDPATKRPISQFSDLIDTCQYREDLKTFSELIGELAPVR